MTNIPKHWRETLLFPDLEAVKLRESWAIKPKGTLGTCGWIDGKPWSVIYVKNLDSPIIRKRVKHIER